MRPCYSALLAALLLVAAAPAAALAETSYVATLDGLQQVPPNASPATGSGIFVLNNAHSQLSFDIQYSGLVRPGTGSQIHNAPPGVNGAAIFPPLPFIAASYSGTMTGTWPIPLAMVAALDAGDLYVDIHSTGYPGGEIRGQILAAPTPIRRTTWGRIKSL